MYFFIQQTTYTISEVVDLLKALDVRGNVRAKLVTRLQKSEENLTIGKINSSNPASVERQSILGQLKSKSFPPSTIVGQRIRFFEALTHVTASDFDQDYIFALLIEHVLPSLSQLNGLDRTAFRKVLCHLDITWYKAASA